MDFKRDFSGFVFLFTQHIYPLKIVIDKKQTKKKTNIASVFLETPYATATSLVWYHTLGTSGCRNLYSFFFTKLLLTFSCWMGSTDVFKSNLRLSMV